MEKTKLDILYETIGFTRSRKHVLKAHNPEDVGKIIEYFKTTPRFNPDDFLDAYALFNYLALRAQRRNMTSIILEDHANAVFREFVDDQFEQAKAKAGIITAFDLQNHARSLVNLEFKEF